MSDAAAAAVATSSSNAQSSSSSSSPPSSSSGPSKLGSVERKSRKAAIKALPNEAHNIHRIFPKLRQLTYARFNETVEVAVALGVDPRKPNQSIKSVARLPHGTGKMVRVCVFAEGADAQAAKDAGAEVVGADEVIKGIQEGNVNFDTAIATPEMMGKLGKIGKVSARAEIYNQVYGLPSCRLMKRPDIGKKKNVGYIMWRLNQI
jgi:Ribosomal protein L1p/L10e family